jgi:hypothetical protein
MDSLIERTGHGQFQITTRGRTYLAERRADRKAMSDILDKIRPKGL